MSTEALPNSGILAGKKSESLLSLTYQILETLTTRVGLVILKVLKNIVLARALGPEGRGLIAVAESVQIIYLKVAALGQQVPNLNHLGKDSTLLGKLLGNSIFHGLGIGTLISIVLGIFFLLFPGTMPVTPSLLWIVLITAPIFLTAYLFRSLLLGVRRISVVNGTIAGATLLGFLFIFVSSKRGWLTPELVSVIEGFAALVTLALLSYFLFQRAPRISFSWSLFKNSLFFGGRVQTLEILGMLMVSSDIFMINRMLGPEATGYYALAAKGADFLYIIPSQSLLVLLPRITGIPSLKERWNFLAKVGVSLCSFMALICLPAYFFMEPLISFAYGDQFLPAAGTARVLILYSVLLCANEVTLNFFYSTGLPSFAITTWTLALFAKLILNFFLINQMGVVGAAFSGVYCMVFIFLLNYFYILINTRKTVS